MAYHYLGYATAQGIEILKHAHGEGTEKISIPSVKIGNILWPSPAEMGVFIATLSAEDTLVSPSGPNVNYLAGAYRHGAEVRWINPALLRDKLGERRYKPEILRQLFEAEAEDFYLYGENDLEIANLAILYAAWTRTERERIAVSNALDQSLRKEIEFFAFYIPDREAWVKEKAERMVKRLRGTIRRGKVMVGKRIIGGLPCHSHRRIRPNLRPHGGWEH